MDIWTPKTGDSDLEVTPEENNEQDKFAAAIYHDKRVVGHAPKNLSKQFYQFLSLPSCFISCETGKRVNKYKFTGPEKAINWMKTQVNKKVNDIVKNTEHYMS